MLHIILLILKIVGMVLLAILALLVLLICVTLFCPVKYELHLSGQGTLDSIKGNLKISWLFRIIRGKIKYENSDLDMELKVLWKKMLEENGDESKQKQPKKTKKTKKTKKQKKQAVQVNQENQENQNSKDSQDTQENQENQNNKDSQGTQENQNKREEKTREMQESVSSSNDSAEMIVPQESNPSEKIPLWKKPYLFLKKIYELAGKILERIKKLKCTFEKMCDKIKLVLEKKDLLLEFIREETHQNAFLAAWKEVKRLLKFLKPKRFLVQMTIGMDDPYITGQIFAVYSFLYPYIAKQSKLIPDFENQVLDGTLLLKGKIRVIYILIPAWNLFWNKEVKATYRDIRNQNII